MNTLKRAKIAIKEIRKWMIDNSIMPDDILYIHIERVEGSPSAWVENHFFDKQVPTQPDGEPGKVSRWK